MFVFLNTESEQLETNNFLSNYYFIVEDLSINIKSNIKWIRYSFKFAKSITEILTDEDLKEEYLNFDSNINSSITLQQLSFLKNIKYERHTIELFINDDIILVDSNFNINTLIEKLNNTNTVADYPVYSEYDSIELKIKLNLIEFIIFNSYKYSFGFVFKKIN